MDRLVVVGASLAGLRAAETARREGHAGEVVLVGAEPHLPYDRPPLTKAFLARGAEVDPTLYDEDALRGLGVTLRLGAPATALDVADREVEVDGGRLGYDALVVATGAHARRLDVPGADLPGVHVLRGLDDARAVRAALEGGARTVVVGAGFIGAEVASAVRARGLPVTVVEAAPQPLARALGPTVAARLAALHERHGTDLRTGVAVVAVEGEGRVGQVLLSDGTALTADLVVVGTGADPATGWLTGSGLVLDDGVVTDGCLQAADAVWAAGDVARWTLPDGSTRRLEHWTSASEQGALAARNTLTPGAQTPYAPVPFVWTEWYGRTVHLVGDCRGDDVVLVAQPEQEQWLALYRRDDVLVGALTVDLPSRTPKLRRRVVAGGSFADALASVSS